MDAAPSVLPAPRPLASSSLHTQTYSSSGSKPKTNLVYPVDISNTDMGVIQVSAAHGRRRRGRVALLSHLDSDGEDRVGTGGVLVHGGSTHRAVLLAYLCAWTCD